MIYTITEGIPIRELNNSIDSIAEFNNVDDEVLRFCFLLVDYKSPYRMLSKQLRIVSILTALGLTTDIKRSNFLKKNNKVIASVCSAYDDLQYSIENELLKSCRTQISQWNALFKKEDKDDKEQALAFKVFDKMSTVLSKLKELEELTGDSVIEDNSKNDWTSLELFLHD